MKLRTNVAMLVVLGACGEVSAPTSKDASMSPMLDAAIDAAGSGATDAAPDGPSFANGLLSFEEFTQSGSMSIAIPHTFPNGVKVTRPTSGGTLTATNCNQNSGFYGFGCATMKQYIPDGMIFIGMPNLGLNGTVIEFEFPVDIALFSVSITNSDGSTGQQYTVSGLDLNSNVKASTTISTVAITGWGTNRAQIQATAGFRRVTITGDGSDAIVLDLVRWMVP